MKPIELPIMFMTEDQDMLEQLGIDQDFTDENSEIRMIEFYNINYMYPSSNIGYTLIGSNGSMFCCPKPINQIRNLIFENDRKQRINLGK